MRGGCLWRACVREAVRACAMEAMHMMHPWSRIWHGMTAPVLRRSLLLRALTTFTRHATCSPVRLGDGTRWYNVYHGILTNGLA